MNAERIDEVLKLILEQGHLYELHWVHEGDAESGIWSGSDLCMRFANFHISEVKHGLLDCSPDFYLNWYVKNKQNNEPFDMPPATFYLYELRNPEAVKQLKLIFDTYRQQKALALKLQLAEAGVQND